MAGPSTADHESTHEYLSRAADVARTVFVRHREHELDEQAGPAYLEGFALSRWIFWRRLSKVIELLPARGEVCLDFGCGFGLLLPQLRRRFSSLHGVDLMPGLAREFLAEWDRRFGTDHGDVEVSAGIETSGLGEASVDLILALDVLEHVDALEDILERMSHLLRPGGRLLVSGPTESWWYRLGRRAVGFSGEYHVRSIHDIRDAMSRRFEVTLVGRVFAPLTLFHLLRGVPVPR